MMDLMPRYFSLSMHDNTLMGDIAQPALRAVHRMVCEVKISFMLE
jgi:hypothetical protein